MHLAKNTHVGVMCEKEREEGSRGERGKGEGGEKGWVSAVRAVFVLAKKHFFSKEDKQGSYSRVSLAHPTGRAIGAV
jgi:hypothetical protein